MYPALMMQNVLLGPLNEIAKAGSRGLISRKSGAASLSPLIFGTSFVLATIAIEGPSWRLKKFYVILR